ncbi:MAG: helix-turn-helix domain-containing protein [Oscillospiraceae bacterium]|nr:helix-turn-helix domain-containing protein [Oscillospiraceae bacterium]
MKKIISWNQVPLIMDIEVAASLFSVTEQTVRNWIKDRDLPIIKMAKTVRIDKNDLLLWINDKKLVKTDNV